MLTESARFLLFRVADQHCAISLNHVREVLPMAELSQPPGTPKILAGFLNLSGVLVPVLRLDRMYGLTEQVLKLYTQLVLVDCSGQRFALIVDQVTGIISAAAQTSAAIGAGQSLNGCAEGILHHQGAIASILAVDRLLLEKERQCLADLQAREQKRLDQLLEAPA